MAGLHDLTQLALSAIRDVEGRTFEANQTIDLEGLVGFHTSGPVIEIELIEGETGRRCVAYASGVPSYLILPKGKYLPLFRLIQGQVEAEFRVLAFKPSLATKVEIAFKKARMLGLRPSLWLSAIRSRIKSKTRAVGLNLTNESAKDANLPSTRRSPTRVKVPAGTSVSIVIPTKIRHDLLSECVQSLEMIKVVDFEVIIVDNGSEDPEMHRLLQTLQRRENICVIRQEIPFNFSRLCNVGARHAKYELILFLNDDVEAMDGEWLHSMCSFALSPDVGVVGARLLYPSLSLQHAGIATNLIPGPGHPWRNLPKERWVDHPIVGSSGEVDAVTGACLLIRRSLFDHLKGFDEERFAVTMNDVDLCSRARKLNLKIICDAAATLLHKERQTRDDDENRDQRARHLSELVAFCRLYPDFATKSVFYPDNLRRDTELAHPIIQPN